MKHNKLILISGTAVVLITGAVGGYMIGVHQQKDRDISSYEECVAAGYPILESYPARCTIPGGKSFAQNTTLTLEGRVVCLQHKNSDGPQTLECATGLLTDDGKYYTLRSDEPGGSLAGMAGSDKRVRITGTLRQNDDDKYKSEGIIQLESYDLL